MVREDRGCLVESLVSEVRCRAIDGDQNSRSF